MTAICKIWNVINVIIINVIVIYVVKNWMSYSP